VQNTTYKSSNGVTLSNFLLPSAWIPGAAGPWDYLGVMQSQDDYSNGYEIVASINNITEESGKHPNRVMGKVVQKHGGTIVARGMPLTALQLKRKKHPWSRSYRRGVRFGG
jgi:hypothetical protein